MPRPIDLPVITLLSTLYGGALIWTGSEEQLRILRRRRFNPNANRTETWRRIIREVLLRKQSCVVKLIIGKDGDRIITDDMTIIIPNGEQYAEVE